VKRMILAMLLAATAAYTVRAGEVQAGTLAAWQEHLKRADLRMQDRAGNYAPFLWLDESPDRRRGKVVIAPVVSMARLEERDGGVYLKLEALALTRNIPASVAWMVNPVVACP